MVAKAFKISKERVHLEEGGTYVPIFFKCQLKISVFNTDANRFASNVQFRRRHFCFNTTLERDLLALL